MIVAGVILRAPGRFAEEEQLVERLQRGGVRAAAVDDVQRLASLLQDWDVPKDQVAAFTDGSSASNGGLTSMVSTVLPWPAGANSTAAIQALVQLNARCAANCNSQQQQQHHYHHHHHQQQQQQQEEEDQERITQLGACSGVVTVVGYAMRLSREQQLADQGLLTLLPAPAPGGCSICFMPLDLSRPLGEQGRVDVVLHKASDELVSGPGGGGGGSSGAPQWSDAILSLQQQLGAAPGVAVVDPFEATAKVVDRAVLCAVLEGLEELQLPGGVRARAPRHLVAESLLAPDLRQQLSAAGLTACALMVKPIPACGVAGSHSMALVLDAAALPALASSSGGGGSGGGVGVGEGPSFGGAVVVQEFANHGGLQYKAYAIGDKVFYSTRASIPDAMRPAPGDVAAAAAAGGLERFVLRFDSLASLPTKLPGHMAAASSSGSTSAVAAGGATAAPGACAGAARVEHVRGQQQQQQQQQQQPQGREAAPLAAGRPAPAPGQLHSEALERVAGYLRDCLGLMLFGFDVVVCASSGEWLVIDVNYFPNYKGGPPETAAWFRGAIAQRLIEHRKQLV